MSSSIVALYGTNDAGDLVSQYERVEPEHIKVTLARHFLSGAQSAIVGYNGKVYLCTKQGRADYTRQEIDESHEHYSLGILFQNLGNIIPQQKRQYRTGRGQPPEAPSVIQNQLI